MSHGYQPSPMVGRLPKPLDPGPADRVDDPDDWGVARHFAITVTPEDQRPDGWVPFTVSVGDHHIWRSDVWLQPGAGWDVVDLAVEKFARRLGALMEDGALVKDCDEA